MSRAAVLVAALAAGGAFAATGPQPAVQAQLDGCTRDNGAVLQHLAPNWVYVNDKDAPAGGPPPPPRWAHGTASSLYEPELGVHPAGSDLPFTHASYDVVVNVRVDPQDAALLGGDEVAKTGNFAGQTDETARLHSERESAAFRFFAWPENGDRVDLLGSWVWDCDHYEAGEHTELHPFRAIWVERNPGGPSPRSPSGEFEGDLFISTEKTYAGVQADCAHRTKGDRIAFKGCLATEPSWQDVSGSYSFALAAPPKPAPGARLRVRVVDAGSTARAPALSVKAGARGVVLALDVAPAPNARLVVAKQVFVGWSPTPARATPVHLRLRVRELLVRRALDPSSTRTGQHTAPPGEWNVYMDVAGLWRLWRPRVLAVEDGETIARRDRVDFYVARNAPWRLLVVTRECDFGALGSAAGPGVALFPCPLTREVGGSGEDAPGLVLDRYRSPAAALGLHRSNARLEGSSCPPSNRLGCYRLTYSVERIEDEGLRARHMRYAGLAGRYLLTANASGRKAKHGARRTGSDQ